MAKDFNFKEITTDFVKNELLDIDCKKAVGLDGLHPKLVKNWSRVYIWTSHFSL